MSRQERTETAKELLRKIKLNKQGIVKFKKSLSEAEKKSKMLESKLVKRKKAEEKAKPKAQPKPKKKLIKKAA